MGRIKDEQLFTLIRNYLLVYLPVQRGASEHTVTTYRTALNKFLLYVASIKKIPVTAVTFEMFSYDMINQYLDQLSTEMSVATRNNRLAVLKAFVAYAAACKPEFIALVGELDAIKSIRNDRFAKVDYMTEAAVKALLLAPDTSTRIGLRDQFIMILLYDTGARIQELMGIRLCDIRMDSTPTVRLFGKGRKTRLVPLMKDTVDHLENYLKVFHKNCQMLSEEHLFYVERKGVRNPMCDDTVRVRIQIYADKARLECSEVPETVYPHLWRHTRAMHLYQHGMDLTLISQWLGHANLETTLIYAHADTEDKRKAIEKAMASGDNVLLNENKKYTVSDEELLRRLYGL